MKTKLLTEEEPAVYVCGFIRTSATFTALSSLWRSMCAVLRVVVREGLKHDNPHTQHAKQVLVKEDLSAFGRTNAGFVSMRPVLHWCI